MRVRFVGWGLLDRPGDAGRGNGRAGSAMAPDSEGDADQIWRRPHASRDTGSTSMQRGKLRAGCAKGLYGYGEGTILSRRFRLGRKPADRGPI